MPTPPPTKKRRRAGHLWFPSQQTLPNHAVVDQSVAEGVRPARPSGLPVEGRQGLERVGREGLLSPEDHTKQQNIREQPYRWGRTFPK